MMKFDDVDDIELLREALIFLDQAINTEQESRLESEALLEGLTALNTSVSIQDCLSKIYFVLKRMLRFEHAFIIAQEEKDQYKVISSTNESLNSLTWSKGDIFNQVLEGKTVSVTDTSAIQEWKSQPDWVLKQMRAALLAPLKYLDETAILICAYPGMGGYGKREHTLITKFSVLASQALQKFEQERWRIERDAAVKANVANSVFIANISHELRTPLHGILSFARFGQTQTSTASQETLKSFFDEIYQSGTRLMNVVDDLLDIAKLESGVNVFSKVQADLMELVGQVVSESKALAAENQLQLSVHSESPSVSAQVNRQKIMQVLRNLIVNAIKFSTRNTTIQILLKSDPEKIHLTVVNRGVGIPKTELVSIFDRFVQSSRTRTGAGGTGLGLAICMEIVKQHRGKIWAESENGDDTKFHVELPRKQAN